MKSSLPTANRPLTAAAKVNAPSVNVSHSSPQIEEKATAKKQGISPLLLDQRKIVHQLQHYQSLADRYVQQKAIPSSVPKPTQLKFSPNQTKASSSLRQISLPANHGVHQLVVNLAALAGTRGGLYHVSASREELLSTAAAPPPKPRALYNEKPETSTAGAALKEWKPRSKLADKRKLNGTIPVPGADGVTPLTGMALDYKVLAEVVQEVLATINDRRGDNSQRLGTAGINDCLGYATTLQDLIAHYDRPADGSSVGAMFVHQTLGPPAANFPYHAATVVAEDGPDLVTLEAHAGQDLTAPVFHIRTDGQTGFDADNHRGAPGQYRQNSIRRDMKPVDAARNAVHALKRAWDHVDERGTSSYVKASEAIPWYTIAGLMNKVIGAYHKLPSIR